jgi:hypothetical protein
LTLGFIGRKGGNSTSNVYSALTSKKKEEEPSYRFLDPGLLEELTNSQGKPRLNVARNMLLNVGNLEDLGYSSLEEALEVGEELFSFWRDLAEYMVLRKEYVGKKDLEDEYFAVKCSKRGNDVYQRRIKTRLGWLNREISDQKFFEIKDFQVNKAVKTSLLWVTLTWDTSRGDIIYAWETLGEDFNRFISALRRKYGKINYLRVWESYESGYPHVHAVMFFEEARFTVFPHWSESNEKKTSNEKVPISSGHESSDMKLTFRISEKEEISQFWHSHVDIQAISSFKAVFTYIKKHQEKIILGLSGSIQEGASQVGFDLENIKGLRTLFLAWIFRKRSFSVSGRFREKIHDLISHLHNSNMEGQRDLEGNLVVEWIYHFLGVFSGSELQIPSGIWVKKLEREEVERLLDARAWKR